MQVGWDRAVDALLLLLRRAVGLLLLVVHLLEVVAWACLAQVNPAAVAMMVPPNKELASHLLPASSHRLPSWDYQIPDCTLREGASMEGEHLDANCMNDWPL